MYRSPAYLAAPAAVMAASLLALMLTGCGEDPQPSRVDLANTINYGSFGTKADIDCGRGKSLNVGGSNNTLNVVGQCGSVTVSGADNTITVARVDGQVTVAGLNNSVTYRAGEPAVEDTGSGNRVGPG